jgi:hypothetical protein
MTSDEIDKLHTTELGAVRIARNLGLTSEPVAYCKERIRSAVCSIERRGKNWYATIDREVITINARSLTIITAHARGTK